MTFLAVGNDVVDRGDPRCAGKATDSRFVDRVYTAEEIAAIESAPDPDLALWLRWAAKEAAFKVVSKLRGTPPPFAHAAFASEWEDPPPADDRPGLGAPGATSAPGASEAPRLSGSVRYRDRRIALLGRITTGWIHVLAVPAGEAFERVDSGVEAMAGEEPPLPDPADAPAWTAFLETRFSPAERASIHSASSALVRLRAREVLSRRLGDEEGDLEIVCRGGPAGRTPPQVLVCGTPSEADVSLSHHRRWVAWAVTAG